LSWLVAEGLIETSPAKDLKSPKIHQKVVSTLSDEEIKAILGVLSPTYSLAVRNQTIVILLLDTGVRIGELINLKMDDMNINEGLLKVMGKGKKSILVLFCM
jgi:integrase/recombinase XerD